MSQSILKATKTIRPSKTNLQREWYIIDASKEPIGRLATKAANLLTGKNKACYAQDVDMGGMVVVINSKKAVLTGKKPEKKNYFRHSGRIGGLKVISFKDQLAKDASVPIYRAIRGMMPKNRHKDIRMNNRLFIFDSGHNLTHKMIEAN